MIPHLTIRHVGTCHQSACKNCQLVLAGDPNISNSYDCELNLHSAYEAESLWSESRDSMETTKLSRKDDGSRAPGRAKSVE